MINYYKKYIKYKNKYLQFTHKLIGGTDFELQPQSTPPKVPLAQPAPQPPPSISSPVDHRIFVIVTHQKWLECFLTVFLEDKYKSTKKKFKNCMCLCISRSLLSGSIKVTMVCEGFLDPNDTKKDPFLYFNTLEFNSHDYKCNPIHSNCLPQNTTMMFVRHGNGFHNPETGILGLLKKNLQRGIYKDALLTDLGKEQAEQASVAILRHLSTILRDLSTITGSRVNHCVYFCASILRRAIQTSSILLSRLLICRESYCTGITSDLSVYVFYNINEVVNCDGNTGTLNPENTPTCKRTGVIFGNDCSTMPVNSGNNVKFPQYLQTGNFNVLSIFTQVQSFNPESYRTYA